MRPVFVQGIGAITPLGATWVESVARLRRGESAVGPVTLFDTSGFPSTVAAEVTATLGPGADRRIQLALGAAREAASVPTARLAIEATRGERIGVFIGAESGRATPAIVLALSRAAGGGSTFDHTAFGSAAPAFASDIDAASLSPSAVASAIAGSYGALGPVRTVSLACASGAAAIIDATRAIRAGVVDVAICGGVGADVDPLMLVGFGKLGALSAKGASRPFDIRRDGFVVGEGAAIVVLSATGPGSGVRVTGVGSSLDAHHLTAPDPKGRGAESAMRKALAEADVSVVGYVQAHGTSTPLNDEVEAAAIARVVPGTPAVSSIKGAVGHWVAGAGAVGFLAATTAVTECLLPTANLEQPDPRCDVDHVVGVSRDATVGVAMVNAFAFGGANCSLVIEGAA